MKIKKTPDSNTLIAVTALLTPSFPDITPESLVQALVSYGPRKPETHQALTRRETANLLHVSLPTVNRMLNEGRLKRIKLNDSQNGAVRIEYNSVMSLLS